MAMGTSVSSRAMAPILGCTGGLVGGFGLRVAIASCADGVCLERAVYPLHRTRINSEPLSNLPHA